MQLWPDSDEMKSWCCYIAEGIREASCFIQSPCMNLTGWIPWSDQKQVWKALSLGSILWSICITATTNMLVGVLCKVLSRLGGEKQWISSVSQLLLFPVFCISKLFDIFIDKMESEQYLFVMRSFFMQNKFHTLIQDLVLQTIQPDTLTTYFCIRWTGWQEVIYRPYNTAAD